MLFNQSRNGHAFANVKIERKNGKTIKVTIKTTKTAEFQVQPNEIGYLHIYNFKQDGVSATKKKYEVCYVSKIILQD
jgi:C-terminal processing protease CtpA/Prc